MRYLKNSIIMMVIAALILTNTPINVNATTKYTDAQLTNTIKEKLKKRSKTISLVNYESANKSSKQLLKKSYRLIKNAFADSKKPDEGQYLYKHVCGYRYEFSFVSISNKTRKVIYKYSINYLDNAFESKKMPVLVKKALKKANVKSKDSKYKRIKKIYDYLCKNISYDYSSFSNIKYTAYGALKKKKAVCQGYSLAMYRMLKTVGIDCKLVSSKKQNHMWLIVKLKGKYYYCDPTWDSSYVKSTGEYRYFLKGTTDFPKHRIVGKKYGISKKGYRIN